LNVVLTRIGLVVICSVLMTARSWAGQDSTARVLTSSDIKAEIGTDVDASSVVAQVLTHLMVNHERREFFLASQIRAEWLPVVQGVEFVRLSETEIPGHLAKCGYYWIINRLERSDNVVSLWLGQRCGGTTLHYLVSFDGRDWRLGPPGGGGLQGIGSGFEGRPPGCPCLAR
jgi:hypothetical protein